MKNIYLSKDRLRKSSSTDNRTEKQQFESDRGRVLFSAPFRRLQSKAQVFSLEGNASVRSRLTHTMEVAHVGRYIVHKLYEQAVSHNDQEFVNQCGMIEPLVETACLLHDIGNPPFGHLGEHAIQEWFKSNAKAIYQKSTGKEIDVDCSYYLDFVNFDGNPQGVRIAITLQGFPSKKGLNLTLAQIASIIKYPRFSSDPSEKYKKIAAFTSEKEDIKNLWEKLKLNWGERHPLVYLMEAADDIAYCLSDIEDGIEKKIISEDVVIDYLRREFESLSDDIKKCIPNEDGDSKMIVSKFLSFRTSMINLLVEHAAKYFYEHKDDISSSNTKAIFHKNDDFSLALKAINDYCIENIYQSQEAEDIEIAGYNIVYGLLDKFSVLMEMDSTTFKDLVDENKGNNLARRMLSKLPDNLVAHYKETVKKGGESEWFVRFQLIVDHISGMTDDYALRLYRLLHGIEVSLV